MWRLLAVILLLPWNGQASDVKVEVRKSEVWIVRDGTATRLTLDGKAKSEALLSPSNDRIAYYEECPEGEHCIPSVVILDLKGRRITSFHAQAEAVPDSICTSILSIAWVSEKAIGIECHLNPSLSEYVETDLASGRTTRDLLGYWFTPSPDGRWVAHVGWIPHFSPPPAQSNYLQIDNTTVYPLPPGSSPVEQKGDDAPPGVVQTQGLTSRGIHDFVSDFSWSPDSQRVALVDCTYDWTANSPGATSEGEGTESNRACSLVVVNRSGRSVSLPLGGAPANKLRESQFSWESPRQVTLRAGDTTKTLTAPW